MLVPRYLYKGDFSPFFDDLLAQKHAEKTFARGEQLWRPGEFIERVYYIEEGIARTSFVNADGRQKALFYHGAGMVFPGCHESQFAIERSLVTEAVRPVSALEFCRADFLDLTRRVPELGAAMFENYARYINVLIFETAHQDGNDGLVKLCNLLELLAMDAGGGNTAATRVECSQEELAQLLSMNRVSVARLMGELSAAGVVATHRGWVEILDHQALLARCTGEVALLGGGK